MKPWPNLHMTFINTFNIAFASCLFLVNLMWLNFVGRGDFFMRDGLHLTGKGAAVLACEFVRVVDEGTGTINYLN